MSNIKIVHLNDIPMDFAESLAQIVNEDIKLQNALGTKQIKITENEFITFSKEWVYDRNADMFVLY